MKRLLVAGLIASPMAGVMMSKPIHAQTPAQTATTRKNVVFACRMTALTLEQRKQHLEVLSPAMKSARIKTVEIQEGYAFEFPSDAKTFATVLGWVENERLCCPFFKFDIHLEDNSVPITLRITGPQGVKQFIKAELPEMVN